MIQISVESENAFVSYGDFCNVCKMMKMMTCISSTAEGCNSECGLPSTEATSTVNLVPGYMAFVK